MGAWKRVMLAALIMGGMAACDDADDTSAQETTNQSHPSGIISSIHLKKGDIALPMTAALRNQRE